MITVQLKTLLCCRDLPQGAATHAPTVVKAPWEGLHTFVTNAYKRNMPDRSPVHSLIRNLRVSILKTCHSCITVRGGSLCLSLITAVRRCAQHVRYARTAQHSLHAPPYVGATRPSKHCSSSLLLIRANQVLPRQSLAVGRFAGVTCSRLEISCIISAE